jgi:hypothetical protein
MLKVLLEALELLKLLGPLEASELTLGKNLPAFNFTFLLF